MGVFQGDVIIKSMIDLSIQEMRKNPWLLDHVFESLKAIPYISDKYGQGNIDAAKEWFANNQIDVYMRPRDDKDRYPCVTVYPSDSKEKDENKTMGDMSTETVILMPLEIGKTISYVVKPFTPTSYDPMTGEIGIPDVPGADTIVPGQVIVNPANGTGYVIQMLTSDGVLIEPGMSLDATQLGVVPMNQFYEANIKHTWNNENYSIGCYAHGDVQNLIWLHSIVYYAIMRYRETLLEGNGFNESNVSSGSVDEDPNYSSASGEKAYVRFINVTGIVEQSWISAPKRFIESIALKEKLPDNTFSSGIKILSNLNSPDTIDPTEENWTTIDEDDES